MSPRKEKQKLIETLRFVPCTYRVELVGNGGEVVLGTVDKVVYDYFEVNNIDVAEYAYDWANDLAVPKEYQPFPPGEWHQCDSIAHESGVEMDPECTIIVYNNKGRLVWQHSLFPDSLLDAGVSAECVTEKYADHGEPGTAVFYGQLFGKGTFATSHLDLTSPFDPMKLKFTYVNIDGWHICSAVEYDSEELINADMSVRNKDSTFSLTMLK